MTKIASETLSTKVGNITIYTMVNHHGASVSLSSLGAGIISIIVPDKNGKLADVTLGYDNIADYMSDGPCAGKTPGRYANRIAKGEFDLDGKSYKLNINNGPNHLHGGPNGFQNCIWNSQQVGNGVEFTLISLDGNENYPGDLSVKVTYFWNDDYELSIFYEATTNKPTIINLTNHTYFNLGGENSGSVLNEKLKLECSTYLPTDDTLIPTGEIVSVKNTPMDFTSLKALGEDIKADFPALKYGKGYDNCWVIDGWQKNKLTKAVELTDDVSGRILVVETTQPAVQIYTGNWLAGSPLSKSKRSYNDYDGVAIECQGMPDAPNKPNFPSQELRPGEIYKQEIKYIFKTKNK